LKLDLLGCATITNTFIWLLFLSTGVHQARRTAKRSSASCMHS
jgi:hypothetical protein